MEARRDRVGVVLNPEEAWTIYAARQDYLIFTIDASTPKHVLDAIPDWPEPAQNGTRLLDEAAARASCVMLKASEHADASRLLELDRALSDINLLTNRDLSGTADHAEALDAEACHLDDMARIKSELRFALRVALDQSVGIVKASTDI